jgi:predicted RNA-binding Zn-ribbon protein involved in translation (DUF1610 family)
MPTIAKHVRLHAFPQADPTRHHILGAGPDQGGTLLLQREESEDSHDCSACGAPLLEGCRLDRLPGVVFRCRVCGAYSIP